ncbi:ArsA-related P-loop ATPase [Bdellovibrionota bacterium FG-1]
MIELIRDSRIIVCCGAGGVGKTTAAGAIALAGARLGRKVLVLTIDPSRRLAEALGVSPNLSEPVRLAQSRLEAAGVKGSGTLDAWMLDPKLIADEAVRRIVQNPQERELLLQNSIYQHITTMVAGMHEYTAMQALHRFVQEGRYELVVLDTPPSRHALDFLEAPGRLSRFLEGRVFKMFMPDEGSSIGGLRRAAGGLINRVFHSVLGEQFASDLTVFFSVFAGVLHTLTRDVTGMREFLSRPEVAFLLITSPAPAALEEALFFQRKTTELNLPFRGFILNRSHALHGARVLPTPADLAPGREADLSPVVRSAIAKLAALGESEKALFLRDHELLDDLTKRAGPKGFALALPMLLPSGDELGNLGELAQRCSAPLG